MDDKTLTALKESIEHWQRMANGQRINDEQPDASSCALCRIFLNGDAVWQDCDGCPIATHTGKTHCSGTPYRSASLASDVSGLDSQKFKDAAQKMLEFLVSLFPK